MKMLKVWHIEATQGQKNQKLAVHKCGIQKINNNNNKTSGKMMQNHFYSRESQIH